MKLLKLAAGFLLLTVMTVSSAIADDDAAAIRHLMNATFEKPESRLSVEPVTVYKDVAVAGWSQGEMGGRALLRKKDNGWVLTLCSGDALKEARSLQHFGLNAKEAEAMAAAVVEAEAKLDPSLTAKFSTFDGVVMMDAGEQHPPADGHAGEHKS